MGEIQELDRGEAACAHELFERWATRIPEQVAVVRAGREVTYRELDSEANRLAARLRTHGVGPEVVVGLLLDRSIEQVTAVLAVWKAGGAYVPLSPSQPPTRTASVLSDTRAPVVLTNLDPLGLLPGRGERVLRLDDPGDGDRVGLFVAPPDRQGSGAGRRNLAYVLYTSGSTGSPKGVLVEHGGVVNLAAALGRLFGDLQTARVFQFAPITFDAWVWELAMSLLNGATLCLPSEGAPLCGPALAGVLRQNHITHLSASPSLLASLPVDNPPVVATMVAGGEVLPEFLAARWSSRVRLFNAYGPTEATVCATAGLCRNQLGKPSIGRPLGGVEVHVLAPTGNPLPVGAIGELHVGGEGVARGYLNRSDLTEERFVADHVSGRPGARLYRTGDLARWLAGGDLEFVGRIDDQLKVRGYRIEPGEVEEALRNHPRVSGAVVTTCETRDGDRRLIAYVEAPGGEPMPVPELRRFLRTTLPDYMVPSLFLTLDRLPLTTHGKVDHAALPAPDGARPSLGHAYVAPRGTLERELAGLWADLLGLAEVGETDDFFSLGGTSLDLLRLQEKVAERWTVRIPTVDLVRAHNVRLLAALLDSGAPAAEPADVEMVAVREKRIHASRQLRSRRRRA